MYIIYSNWLYKKILSCSSENLNVLALNFELSNCKSSVFDFENFCKLISRRFGKNVILITKILQKC